METVNTKYFCSMALLEIEYAFIISVAVALFIPLQIDQVTSDPYGKIYKFCIKFFNDLCNKTQIVANGPKITQKYPNFLNICIRLHDIFCLFAATSSSCSDFPENLTESIFALNSSELLDYLDFQAICYSSSVVVK